MKKRVFIIHGWEGYPEEGWFPWLSQELEAREFEVTVPAMPETNTPRIERWLPYLHEVIGTPDEHTYLIGHSMGARAIMHYTDQLPIDAWVGGIVSVAGAFILRGMNKEEAAVLRPWIETPLDALKIRRHTDHIVALFSDNDPWIPLVENQQFFKNNFEAQTHILKDQGHFSGSDGITELPLLLKIILDLSELSSSDRR